MSPSIHIPAPCSENFSAMPQQDAGRYCSQCCHVVIDFTDWQPEAIRNYLEAQAGKRVCGHFRQEQVAASGLEDMPMLRSLFHSPLSFLKKIAAIIVIAFCCHTGASAQQPTLGAPMPVRDTAHRTIMGKPAPPRKPTKTKPPTPPRHTQVITGLIAPPPTQHPDKGGH